MKNFLALIFILSVWNSALFAQVDETKYFEYLRTTFAQKSDDEAEFLILQFKEYLDSFPMSQNNDGIYFFFGMALFLRLFIIVRINTCERHSKYS